MDKTTSKRKRVCPKRVLIYRIGSLGDTVVALPAFHLIAKAFPASERRLLTSFPSNAKAPLASSILEHTGLVHGYFHYALRTRSIAELFKLWWNIARWRPQTLVDISPASGIADAKRNTRFFRLCGVRNFIGSPLTDDMQLHRPVPIASATAHRTPGPLYEPEYSRLVRNINALGQVDLNDPTVWDLRLTDAENRRAQAVIAPLVGQPLIGMSLGTKWQPNEWGLTNWSSLIGRLAREYTNYGLVIVGADVEFAESEQVAEGWRTHSSTPVLNLCGALTPRESAAALSRVTVFLCQDSGPMHLAAAVRTPCVAVFSSKNLPGIWFPVGDQHRILCRRVDCENCGLDICIEQKKKCILSISVDEVFAQVVDILGYHSGPHRLGTLGIR